MNSASFRPDCDRQSFLRGRVRRLAPPRSEVGIRVADKKRLCARYAELLRLVRKSIILNRSLPSAMSGRLRRTYVSQKWVRVACCNHCESKKNPPFSPAGFALTGLVTGFVAEVS
jgi:hypothetical protein